jgi:hypothetical protein
VRKWSWPNLRCEPGIYLEGLGKTTNSLSQDSLSGLRTNVVSIFFTRYFRPYPTPPPRCTEDWFWNTICVCVCVYVWHQMTSNCTLIAIEVRSPTGAEYFSSSLCVQTGSGAHPASYSMGTGGSFPRGKARPGRDADHSPPSSPEVKNE